jgi:hypothetical protein
MISTPSHLTAYLAALAAQLPDVRHVITGEGSRQEEGTKSTARYPQVQIETPEAYIPASGDQKGIGTTVYIIALPQGTSHAKEDLASDRAYRIAETMISAIRSHADSEEHGFSISEDMIEISPIISKGSDQARGWRFDLHVMIDQSCIDFDPDAFFMPQFRVAVSGDPDAPTISITDTSIGDSGIEREMWHREEVNGTLQTIVELDSDTIELDPTDPESTYRIVHIWMRMVSGGITLWTYARVHSGDTGGYSVPYAPHHPA